MKKTIKELYSDFENIKDEVNIGGWIRNIRVSKDFGFIEINDGSCLKNVQVVIERKNLDNFDKIAAQNVGASLTVSGGISVTPEMKQPFEIKAFAVTVEGASSPSYPLQKKRHSMEYLRTVPHLRPRTNTFSAVFRLRSEIAFAIHEFFHRKGFVYVHTPIITASDCEGAGEMFRVTVLDPDNVPKTSDDKADYSKDFFKKPAKLTVSGQLEGETFAMAFKNIYTFGPTFRAENSNTPRHAAEFWMIEPEMAFAGLSEDMELAEEMLKYIIAHIMKNAADELDFFNSFVDKELISRLDKIRGSEFARVSYTEAIKLLEEAKCEFNYPVSWGMDLQTEHERYLSETIFKKPVFVTDYPKEIKAFYMRLNDDGKTVAAMDLLVPKVGEIIGGSQREEREDVLLKRMAECNMRPEDYNAYLDLRRFGSAKHAGFGLGFERAVMYFSGMQNIRDVIPYPRTSQGL